MKNSIVLFALILLPFCLCGRVRNTDIKKCWGIAVFRLILDRRNKNDSVWLMNVYDIYINNKKYTLGDGTPRFYELYPEKAKQFGIKYLPYCGSCYDIRNTKLFCDTFYSDEKSHYRRNIKGETFTKKSNNSVDTIYIAYKIHGLFLFAYNELTYQLRGKCFNCWGTYDFKYPVAIPLKMTQFGKINENEMKQFKFTKYTFENGYLFVDCD